MSWYAGHSDSADILSVLHLLNNFHSFFPPTVAPRYNKDSQAEICCLLITKLLISEKFKFPKITFKIDVVEILMSFSHNVEMSSIPYDEHFYNCLDFFLNNTTSKNNVSSLLGLILSAMPVTPQSCFSCFLH